ncbi:lysosomal acid lipase-related [Holotrichia oblita]|uniref:Lysosomal acid lipase-related n=1 Tax=Holotrichia oblita TaxID=644536 RepID=A0ACB9SWF3_HOLOL|nr:lysosomal acid lipase-related [Holotrichia oblita]
MCNQTLFCLLLIEILIATDLIVSLTEPNNVCKTFEGYYTNKDCYYNPDQISEVVIITLLLSIFWWRCFDELGSYDIVSTIDFIHKTTNKSTIYIGYSLGAIAGHVYSSLYPDEAANKIKVMISMAPATLIETSQSILRFLRPIWNTLQRLVNAQNHGELFTHNGPLIKYIRSVCFPYPHQLKMCLGFIQLAFGLNEDQINPETLPVTLYHDGDSTSIKTIVHLSQIAASRRFRKFDYGEFINLDIYNSSSPPIYNLTSIKVPNHLIYGKGDFVAGKKAVSDLYHELSKIGRRYGVYAVKHPSFAHTDFIIGKDVKKLVYDHIVEFLKKIRN